MRKFYPYHFDENSKADCFDLIDFSNKTTLKQNQYTKFKRKIAIYISMLSILCLFTINQKLIAQTASQYTFSTTGSASLASDLNGNSINMSAGTTQLVAASQDDQSSGLTNIGFSFTFMDNIFTQFSASSNGGIRLGAVISSTTYGSSFPLNNQSIVAPYLGDLATNSNGKVHYKLIGAYPNRTLVIEFLNMRINYGSSTADGTFQVRLYEQTNVIEYAYGGMKVNGTSGTNTTGRRVVIGFQNNNVNNTEFTVDQTSYATSTTTTEIYNTNSSSGNIASLNSSADGSRRNFIFTPTVAYKSQFISMNTGSTTWCVGETRNVTVTIKNIGTATWTTSSPTINIGAKFNANTDYDYRVSAAGLAPGAQATYIIPITAPSSTSTNENISFDVVKEGACWFRDNVTGCAGPGNMNFVSGTQTITGPTVNAGSALAAICQGGTSSALGGSVGGSATGGIWSDGGIGGAFNPNAITLNASWTPPAAYSGLATLTLTTGGGSCGTTSAFKTEQVNAKPIPTFTTTPTGIICSNTNVTYTTQAGQASYVWTYSGTAGADYTIVSGGTSTSNTVTLKWLTGGSKTVTVNYSSNSCSGATPASATNTVSLRPVPTFINSPAATICSSTDVTYTTQAGQSSYMWTLSAGYTIVSGGIGATNNTVTLQWTTAGSKTVSVNYNNIDGCNSGTSATSTSTVNLRPTPTFSTAPSSPLCSSTNATYTTQSGQTNYAWSVPGIAGTDYTIISGGIGSTNNTVTLQWLTSGSKTVTVNYSISSCSGITPASSTITVNLRPVPTFTASAGSTICTATNVTYTTQPGQSSYVWTLSAGYTIISGGVSATDNTVTLQWTTTGSKIVTVNYNNSDGCNGTSAASSTTTVSARPVPTFTASAGANTCAYTNTTYTTQSGQSSYSWIFTGTSGVDYNIISGGTSLDNTVTLQWITSGNKTVTVNYTNGASCTAIIPVSNTTNVNPRPVPTFVSAPSGGICAGSTVTYSTETGQSSYAWTYTGTSGTDYIIVSGGTGSSASVTLKWLTPSTKTVTVNYNTAGCNAITPTSTSNTVNTRPTANINSADVSICNPGNTFITGTITANGAWTITLNNGATATGNGNGTFSIPVSPTITTTYSLASIVDANCSSTSPDLSGSTTVTVNQPVVITTQPDATQNTCATFPVDFIVSATGTGLMYQWYKDGVVLVDDANISGSNTAHLNIDQAGMGDAGTYYVKISGTSPCSPLQSANSVLTVNQEIFITTQPAPQTLCTGSTATFTIAATGTGISYQWRKGTTPLTDGGNISGTNTATLTINNITSADAATNYNVLLTSPGGSCPQAKSANVKLAVNPIPIVNAVTNKIICNNSASGTISFSGSVSGTVYNWTNDNTSIGLAASGTGTIPSFTVTNAGSAPVVSTITVTPSYTNGGTTCIGTPITFTITVNPTATVNAIANQTICNGATIIDISFTSPTTGGSIIYNWTNNKPSIGLAASGTGDIASFTATNTGTAPVTATINVTPSYTNGNTCAGIVKTFTITVNPSPVLSSNLTPPAICNNTVFNYTPSSATSSVTFTWSRAAVAGITNAAATGIGNPNETLVNNTVSPVSVIYVYTLSANSCNNTQNVTVVVNPTPKLTSSLTPPDVCSNSPFVYTATSATSSVSFSWSRAVVTGISNGAASGSNNINETLINTSSAPVNVTYVYTLTTSGCINTQNVVVKVNPLVTISPLAQQICNGGNIIPITISGVVTGTITSWTRDNPSGITSSIATSGSNSISGTFSNFNTNASTVTFTITSQASNGCISTATATIIVDANLSTPVIASSQIICTGSSAAPLTSTVTGGSTIGYTYQWQRSADGATNWTNVGTNSSTYTPASSSYFYRLIVTNGCGSVTSNIVQISTATDFGLSFDGTAPSSTLCSGASFSYTLTSGSILGSLFNSRYIRYTWQSQDAGFFTSPTSNPYGASHDILFGLFTYYDGTATFTVHNTTNAPVTKKLLITPNVYNNNGTIYCNLDPEIITVTINPVPVIGDYSTSICSGTGFSVTPLDAMPTSSTVVPANTKYSWNAPSVAGVSGLAAGSAQTSVNGTLINNTNAPINVVYIVTPTYTAATSCPSTTTFQVTVTVNPTPKISGQTTAICSGGTFNVTPANAAPTTIVPAGTTYTWSAPTGTGFTGGSTGSGSSISGTLINNNSNAAVAVYTITPTSGAAGSCPGAPFTLTVTVNPTLTAGTVTGTTPLCITQTATYTSTGNPGGTWSSSNSGVATVNSGTGMVTGVAAGTATIKYSFASGCGAPVSASQSITVSPNVISGTISGTLSSVCIGSTTTYTSNGTSGGTWSSSNTSIATVNSGTGVVTAISAGTANILYTVTGCNAPAPASKSITVNANADPGIVTGSSLLCIGATTTFLSNGNSGGVWSSSNTSIATVNSAGVVTAVSSGTSNITYTVNTGCNSPLSAFKTVTISPNANPGTVTGTTPLCVNAQVGYSSIGADAGGTWSTSDPSVATVTSSGVVKAIGVGTAIIKYTVTTGCNAPANSSQAVQVLNPAPASAPGAINGASNACVSSGLVYSVSPVANASFYVWTVPSGWTITAGSTTNSITVTASATGGVITVKAGNTCGISAASSLIVATVAVGQWIGITSNWNDAQNWCSGILPDVTTNVTIPVVGTGFYYPIVSTAVARVHNISIALNASITVTGNTLQIAGAIINNGTFNASAGTIEMNGNVAQTIGSNTFQNNDLKNLIINNITSAGVTLGGPLNLYGVLSFSNNNNQKLVSAGNLNLRSTATATAMVADVSNNGTNTGNIIRGNVIVERYYPARRAWRLVTAPVSTNRSIFNSWQVGGGITTNGTAPVGSGTYITSATPGPGLDMSQHFSLDSLNVTTGALVGINNTKGTNLSDSAINPGINMDNRGYFMFVRGDRTPSNIDPNPSHTNVTTLRDTGALQTGTKVYSRNLTSNLFMLIGNPYASPVDFGQITRSANIPKKFWAWDPKLNNTLGSYVFVDGITAPPYIIVPYPNYNTSPGPNSPGQTEIIQSTQAIFVQADGPGLATVTFNENNKSLLNNSTVFRPAAINENIQSLRTNLYLDEADTAILADGNYVQFDDHFSSDVDINDALKFSNILENFGIREMNNTLILDRRPVAKANDTVFFKLWNTTKRNYMFVLSAEGFSNQGLQAFLADSYLKTSTPVDLNGITTFKFSINNDAASKAADRFKIVFKQLAPLPISFTKVKAYQQGSDIKVEWTVESEHNMKQYEVERSVDGYSFTKVATIAAAHNDNSTAGYQWVDENVSPATYYYRIHSYNLSRQEQYSNVVKVTIEKGIARLFVYPNPVIAGDDINIHFINQPKGRYGIRLMDKLGQVIAVKQIEHAEGSSTEKIPFSKTLAHGTYQIEITKPDSIKKLINLLY